MRPKRQRVALAFLGSVLLHGVALALFALTVALYPPAQPTTTPEDEPARLEIVQDDPPDTPPPIPQNAPTPTPTPRQLVDAVGPDADSPPPDDATLSDRSTRASSPEQNDTQQPGAKQASRRMATFQFDPRPPTPGLVSHVDPAMPTPPPLTAPVLPQPDRTVRRPTPTPAPTADPDEFAMAMATPTPTPEDPFDPSIRSTSPPLPKPASSQSAGSLPSALKGSSANRGPGGVDTLATPASRYGHQVMQMIKAVWQRAVDRRDDPVFGMAVIHCTIDKDGLVLSPRIVRNTADVLFGSIALQSVAMARLPPMPPEVVAELGGKHLPMDITFDLTPLPQEAALH